MYILHQYADYSKIGCDLIAHYPSYKCALVVLVIYFYIYFGMYPFTGGTNHLLIIVSGHNKVK